MTLSIQATRTQIDCSGLSLPDASDLDVSHLDSSVTAALAQIAGRDGSSQGTTVSSDASDRAALDQALRHSAELRGMLGPALPGATGPSAAMPPAAVNAMPTSAPPVNAVAPAPVRVTGTLTPAYVTPGGNASVSVRPSSTHGAYVAPSGNRTVSVRSNHGQLAYVAPSDSRAAYAQSNHGERADVALTQTAGVGRGALSAMQAQASRGGDDFSFLDDPNMSLEDKIMMFLSKTMERADRELRAKMQEAREAASGNSANQGGAKAGSAATAAPAEAPGQPKAPAPAADPIGAFFLGALHVLEGALPVIGSIVGLIAGGPVGAMIGQSAGGLASGLAGAAENAAGGAGGAGGAAGAAAGATAPNGSAGSSKERERDSAVINTEIQHLMNLRQEVSTMCSNVLASLHQSQMTAVNNIRG